MNLFNRSMNLMMLLIAALALAFALNVMVLSSSARADDVVQTGNTFYPVDGAGNMMKGTFTVTADASGNVANTAFLAPEKLRGYYLYTVEIVSATDDALTVTITTASGTPLFSKTTTSATTGQILYPAAFYPIYDTPYIDVTSLAATESVTVTVIFVR